MSAEASKLACLRGQPGGEEETQQREEEMQQGEEETQQREAKHSEESERQPTEQLGRAEQKYQKTASSSALQTIVLDKPLLSTPALQLGTELAQPEADKRIRYELTGRIYHDVGGFFERFFEGKTWTVPDSYKPLMAQYVDGCWSGWPEPPLQAQFFDWFMMFQDTVLGDLGHRRYYTSAVKPLNGPEANRKLDIFLGPTDIASSDHMLNWSNVLVVGEHKQSPAEDRSSTTLLQLAGYAREVFGSQPYRRFVLGFTICGSLMRLWVFDRSGAYNSESFDIHQDPRRFVNVVRGYALMTEAELGLNTFVQKDGTDRYIMAGSTKIFLEGLPIASQNDIVCRGTTCFRGSRVSRPPNWEFVVKFSWTSAGQQREGKLLKMAKDKGVTGIAEWFHHEPMKIDGKLDTTLWSDLKFGRPYVLNKTPRIDSAEPSLAQGRRRRDSNDDEGNIRKRSKAADKANTPEQNDNPPTSIHTIEGPDADSLVRIQSGTYNNPIHYCLVVSPVGRPLSTYKCVKELLEVFRDAILGHLSLLECANILHRDISENNIIISESAAEGSSKGLLIDLDMAKRLSSKPHGATHPTGTIQFMAIGVLQGKAHTYRHDLESFFYVFVWMCIHYEHDPILGQRRVKPTRTTILRGWYTGTYQEIANTKRGHMSDFGSILEEFSAYFVGLKDLAYELRNVLFNYPHLTPFTDTYKNPSYMYEGMINAFNKKLRVLETEQGGVGEIGGV